MGLQPPELMSQHSYLSFGFQPQFRSASNRDILFPGNLTYHTRDKNCPSSSSSSYPFPSLFSLYILSILLLVSPCNRSAFRLIVTFAQPPTSTVTKMTTLRGLLQRERGPTNPLALAASYPHLELNPRARTRSPQRRKINLVGAHKSHQDISTR